VGHVLVVGNKEAWPKSGISLQVASQASRKPGKPQARQGKPQARQA